MSDIVIAGLALMLVIEGILPFTAPHFQQWVIGRALCVRGIEQEDVPESRAPSGCQCPVLAFDIVDDRGIGTMSGGLG